jgi:hypothetical protein
MRGFYDSLVAKEASFIASIVHGRSKLRKSRERTARFGKTFEVDDWIVSVAYIQADIPIDLQVDSSEEVISDPFYSINPGQQLIGRDYDIYRLETRLLMSTSHMLQITRFSGAGKSDLLLHLCVWWKRSHFIKNGFYADFRGKEALSDVFTDIAAKYGVLSPAVNSTSSPDFTTKINPDHPSAPSIDLMQVAAEAMRSHVLLLVFDSLESMSQQSCASLSMFLRHLTSTPKPMRSFLILSSCHSVEEPLNLGSRK